MDKEILALLGFYSKLDRELSAEEIRRLLNVKVSQEEMEQKLQSMREVGFVIEEKGYFAVSGTPHGFYLRRKNQDMLLEEKWKKFLSYRRIFRYIPFLDFVIMAGSLAMGNAHEDSDFDVIIGARQGRIFTVRWFSMLFAGLYGVRRGRADDKPSSKDKICLNHFVTPKSYKLQPPYNFYWQALYKNLVPVLGEALPVKKFFEANGWAGEAETPMHYFEALKPNLFGKFLESALFWVFGDVFERIVKWIQIRKIARSDQKGLNPRIRFDDDELEFHPDTSRIDALL